MSLKIVIPCLKNVYFFLYLFRSQLFYIPYQLILNLVFGAIEIFDLWFANGLGLELHLVTFDCEIIFGLT